MRSYVMRIIGGQDASGFAESTPRVRRGMSIDEVRAIWLVQSQAKAKAIIASYKQKWRGKGSGYGREALGVYAQHQQRIADHKVRIAVRLLKSAGLVVDYTNIRKVTGQSTATIACYWQPLTDSSQDG